MSWMVGQQQVRVLTEWALRVWVSVLRALQPVLALVVLQVPPSQQAGVQVCFPRYSSLLLEVSQVPLSVLASRSAAYQGEEVGGVLAVGQT